MFHFGRQVESALIAMKALSLNNGMSISEICNRHSLSKNTLAKTLQALHSVKIVDSIQGVKGGYHITKPLNMISLYDVLNALGELKPLACSGGSHTCDLEHSCTISSPLLRWELKMTTQLKNTFLDELLLDTHEVTHVYSK